MTNCTFTLTQIDDFFYLVLSKLVISAPSKPFRSNGPRISQSSQLSDQSNLTANLTPLTLSRPKLVSGQWQWQSQLVLWKCAKSATDVVGPFCGHQRHLMSRQGHSAVPLVPAQLTRPLRCHGMLWIVSIRPHRVVYVGLGKVEHFG